VRRGPGLCRKDDDGTAAVACCRATAGRGRRDTAELDGELVASVLSTRSLLDSPLMFLEGSPSYY